ncbi:MAG: hypothetical protein EON87_04890 [Brevundimonas sp.]|nr:MAG: hypothetical protein EON87_04890 [Brevundimonas sp.]
MTNSTISSDALSNAIEGGPVFDRMLVYSEEDWAHMSRAAGLFRAIKKLEPGSRVRSLATHEAAFLLNLNRSTIYRLLKKFEGEVVHLFPRQPGPSRGIKCLSSAREALVQTVLKSDYLTKQKITVAELERRIEKACERQGLKKVSRTAIQDRINRLDQHMVALRRGELLKAEDLTLRPGSYDVRAPMERWQIDHTPVDILIISAIDGEVIGRPYLTLIIDVATRMIAGYYISWDRPSARSVAAALLCAVGLKGPLLERLGLQGDWPICGLPIALHSDNAVEFAKSVPYRRGCENYDIRRELREIGKPRDGAHIERLIGTMMARCHFLPGTTFSNIRQREKYDSAAKATLTIDDLEKWLVEQILDYHERRHAGLGCSPRQAWEAMCRDQEIAPRWPKDFQQFYLSFLPSHRATIQRQGVQLLTLEYCGPVLQELRRHMNEKVELRYDPHDLSKVFVQDLKGLWVPVASRYPDCPRITLWEVQAEQRRRRLLELGPARGWMIITEIVRRRAARADASRLTKSERLARERASAATAVEGLAGQGVNNLTTWTRLMEGGK